MAADISVYPRCRSGIDKINVSGIHGLKFSHQLPALAQLIFLMIVFRYIKFVEG